MRVRSSKTCGPLRLAEVGPGVGQSAKWLETAVAGGAEARPVTDLRHKGSVRFRESHPVLRLPRRDGFDAERRFAPL